jgi:signal transduction histidine kinase/ActR/RegA family two-component response regulator
VNEPVLDRPVVPRVWIVSACLALTLAAVIAAGLWQFRRDTIAGQARELSVLALALADELERGLEGVGLVLQATRLELRENRVAIASEAASQTLRLRASQLTITRHLWVIDANGQVLAASGPAKPPELATFAPALDGLDNEGVAISRPFQGAASDESFVGVAIRFGGAAATGGPWIIAAVPAEALRGAFTAASPAADARMIVFRSDGARLAGSLVDVPLLAEAEIPRRLAVARTSEVSILADGSRRLLQVRSLPRYGIDLVLSRNVDAVLASWREVARIATSGLVLLLLALGVAIHRINRADRRRSQAQQALQAQLSRTNKLESLGTLAGGVAHDFNNVLAGVLGYGEMARDAAADGSAQARHLDNVLQAALRGKALVERILAFSRSGARVAVLFDVQPVVEEVLTLLAASLRPDILLERRLDAAGLKLEGEPTQIFEAVMNLCTNGMQAMAGGGVLSVLLQDCDLAQPLIASHGLVAPGRYVKLSVSDQGTGITAAVMPRLFEPLFTTRGEHSGTGLGLAIVHSVVANFNGTIDVETAPQKGSRFTLYLPQAQGEATPAHATLTEPPQGRGQTLLVVDDEASLVALAEELLTDLGYRVVPFNDPLLALEALRENPQRFDAVITDEVMPRLSGTQLTEALRVFAPALPVLLISGYAPQLGSRAALAGVTRVLGKPLQRAELAHALAQLLGVTPSG